MKGIDGWFSEDEGRWYARFARGLRGGIFVEVGSWKGRSTSFAGPVCNANDTRLVCVDHWSGSRDVLADRYASALAVEDVEATFRANMSMLGIVVEVIAASSVVAAARFSPGSVDRVFLDASHDHDSVAEDLRVWSERLKPDGLLAGHDYADKHPEVRAAIESAVARICAAGKIAGILAPVEADARHWLARGCRFVAVGNDAALLARQSEALAAKFKT